MMNAPLAANATPIILGLKLYEVLTLIGIVLGPIFAVIITLFVEQYRAKRDRRIQVLRTLLATMKIAADFNWSAGVNLILVEFNHHKRVMAARKDYMDTVNNRVSEEFRANHNEQIIIKQIALVYQVARVLGYRITEGELRTDPYIAEGMLTRDNILLDSQKAMRELANAQTRMVEITEAAIARNAAEQAKGG